MMTESAAYAVLSVVKSTMTYLYESGLWVGKAVQTYKAFIDAVFKTVCKSSKFTVFIVLNVVNGRCPGYDYFNPVETL